VRLRGAAGSGTARRNWSISRLGGTSRTQRLAKIEPPTERIAPGLVEVDRAQVGDQLPRFIADEALGKAASSVSLGPGKLEIWSLSRDRT
jgi:hypothetical protein